jgi:hypothetical protein
MEIKGFVRGTMDTSHIRVSSSGNVETRLDSKVVMLLNDEVEVRKGEQSKYWREV